MPDAPISPNTPSNTWKYVAGAVILILVIISSFFGYSYKKVTIDLEVKDKKIASLQEQIDSHENETTISVPVIIDGKLAYRTETSKTKDTSINRNLNTLETTDTKSHKETITKKGGTLLGAGYGTDNSENLLIQSDLLGPFGLASTASFSFSPAPSFNEAVVYITFKP